MSGVLRSDEKRELCVITSYSIHYTKLYDHVRVALNPDGSFRNYVSTRKSMSPAARAAIEPLYKQLRDAEDAGGMEASEKILGEFLASHRITSYNVCYTKLLRDGSFYWVYAHVRVALNPDGSVITSYSIHYTKLYEHATTHAGIIPLSILCAQ